VGVASGDTLPGLAEAASGFDFLTFDDGRCVMRGGCPEIAYFDVLEPDPDVPAAELVAQYVKGDATRPGAGVAYTDTSGYQTVILGFGMEFMSDELMPTGHFAPGVSDRVDLMANIMEYFGREPTEPPTGTDGEVVRANRLGRARPNPFNSATAIDFDLASGGHITLRIYDASGRVVCTLVDDRLPAGPHRVAWDGKTDAGLRAASGIYFVKMTVDGRNGTFIETRKAVLLK
jgi:hypothetical protein